MLLSKMEGFQVGVSSSTCFAVAWSIVDGYSPYKDVSYATAITAIAKAVKAFAMMVLNVVMAFVQMDFGPQLVGGDHRSLTFFPY